MLYLGRSQSMTFKVKQMFEGLPVSSTTSTNLRRQHSRDQSGSILALVVVRRSIDVRLVKRGVQSPYLNRPHTVGQRHYSRHRTHCNRRA